MKGIVDPSKEQRDQGGGQNNLRRENPVGESETPVLGERNPPKKMRIPWRIQEIATRGS
jgi:hypothetical protein